MSFDYGKKSFSDYGRFYAEYRVPVSPGFNFARDVLDVLAAEFPDRLAMIHVSAEGRRTDYPLRFFAEESMRLARGLAAAGVVRGDRVALILHRRVEFWTSMLALHRLGAVAVPLPAMLTVQDIQYRFQAGGIRAVIAEDSLCARIAEARPACPELRLAVQAGLASPGAHWTHYQDLLKKGDGLGDQSVCGAGGSDPAILFFSSGTTGEPKMVEHDHTYPLGHLLTAQYWHDLRPGDIHLTVADTGWGKALWGKFYGQWMAGATVFVHDFRGRFNADQLLHLMAEHQVTTFCAPPTTYRLMIRHDLAKYGLKTLRHCTSAGELLNASVFDTWKSSTGISIFEGYGQTETTLQAATFPFMTPRPGSMGKPCPGWDLALLDEEDQPVRTSEVGEICVRLPAQGRPLGLFSRYVNDPELTASVLHDGYYRTGDKAQADEEGYLWFVGRTDDIIKSSGYRIGPFEVESALVSHPAVVESAVTGIPDPLRGQVVKAAVVLAQGVQPSESLVHELQAHVKSVTAFYKYPRVIEFVAELPKTISGKIRRAQIRAQDAGRIFQERGAHDGHP